MSEERATAARAKADQDYAAASAILDGMVADARTVRARYGPVETWAVLALHEHDQLGLESTPMVRKVMGVLVAAAIRIAERGIDD